MKPKETVPERIVKNLSVVLAAIPRALHLKRETLIRKSASRSPVKRKAGRPAAAKGLAKRGRKAMRPKKPRRPAYSAPMASVA